MHQSKIYNAAGKRNNYITLQRASNAAANSANEVLPQWDSFANAFAGSKITGGREFLAAMTVQPLLSSILELPYDSNTSTLTPRDRILDGTRVLNIAAVFNEFENNEKIIVWTTEPVAV